MKNNELTVSWMWPVDDGINALRIDTDASILMWYDAMGCACDDSTVDQSLSDYVAKGTPSQFAPPPADVSAEIQTTLAALTKKTDESAAQ